MAYFPSRPTGRAFIGFAIFACALVRAHAAAPAAAKPVSFTENISPLLQKYCYDCHGNGKSKGDVALDREKTVADVHANAKKWETVLERVSGHEMPPEEADEQPTPAEREMLTSWIEKELFNFDPTHPDPGHVTIHRLNRTEYNNTIRDLVGVEFQPADDFPADNSGYGFDNISSVLSLPPVLMEKYLAAARRILDEAIPTEPRENRNRRFRANLMEVGFNAEGDRGDGWMPLGALEEDGVATTINVPAGDYMVRVQAFATPKGKYASSDKPLSEVPIVLTAMLDDVIVGEWKVAVPEEKPEVFDLRIGVPAGKHRFAFVNHRQRGGANDAIMRNGRLGPLQGGTIWVKWVEVEGPLPTATRRVPANKLEVTGEGRFAGSSRVLEHEGEVALKVPVSAEGEYLLRAQAYAQQAGTEPARMEFRIDGKAVKLFDVNAPAKQKLLPDQRIFSAVLLDAIPQVYEYRVKLPLGEHRFSAAFVNDFADPEAKNPNLRDRNLFIDHLEVASLSDPAQLPTKPEPIQRLFAKAATPAASGFFARLGGKPAAAPAPAVQARTIVSEFARRAWRRPVEAAEIDELMRLYTAATAEGASLEAAVKLPLQAVLVSPFFLFRGETLPAVASTSGPVTARPVSEIALASRLSYFLWSSMPDDELLDLAERGALRQNLDAQVRRMLASPKAGALVANFAGQWLETRNLKFVAPDKKLFPDFDDALRAAMGRETETFFDHIVRQDRSVLEFLTADYTFVNERLAKHYGLKDVTGDDFRRVSLAGTPRRGVLTHASVLTITSTPTRTSPVKRGKWVLEDLLGTPPPPPPPDVPELVSEGKPITGTLRQQMEQHRGNPTCASCHARMDPIGFGLENFDAIGAYRAKDGDLPVDSSGKLVSGEAFGTAAELTGILADKKRENFVRNLSEKMLIYSLGRGVERADRPAVDRIMKELAAGDYRFSSLILATVKSVPFDMQRVDTTSLAAR